MAARPQARVLLADLTHKPGHPRFQARLAGEIYDLGGGVQVPLRALSATVYNYCLGRNRNTDGTYNPNLSGLFMLRFGIEGLIVNGIRLAEADGFAMEEELLFDGSQPAFPWDLLGQFLPEDLEAMLRRVQAITALSPSEEQMVAFFGPSTVAKSTVLATAPTPPPASGEPAPVAPAKRSRSRSSTKPAP